MSGGAEEERRAAALDDESTEGDVVEADEAHSGTGGVDGPLDDAAAAETEPTDEGAGEPADAADLQDDPEQFAAALAEAQRERQEYLDLLRRERAEFENFRKRANRERMEALDRGTESLLADLLGVLDDFARVLEAAEHSEDPQLAKGVEMVHGALHGVLADAGLEEVPGVGAPFDPNWHEAMMQVEADEPLEQPVVSEVLRRGYRFKGRVLRPASVSVAQ